MSDIMTAYTTQPVCPNCKTRADWSAWDADAEDGTKITYVCDMCEQAFVIEVHKTISYSTWKAV